MNYRRLLVGPKTSFFLLGMRGTGKSTWASQTLPNATRVDLLSEATFQAYLVDPAKFARELAALKPNTWVVVDEIQRLPSLLNEVHRHIEARQLKFALLGSSARKLRQAGVNLLGGRAVERHLHPLLAAELGPDFSLERVLRFGSIPLVWQSEDAAERLEAYVQLYLRNEIQAEALVRNLPGFARFLPVAALFHGQVLNLESVARDAGVARSTVQGYLGILEDTLLAFRLPPFEGKLRVKERKHAKLYWADNGVARAAKHQQGAPTKEERGHLFEAFVVQTIRALHELGRCEYDEMYYWASHSFGVEVDVLLQRGRELIAIEVKAGADVRSDWFQGMNAIAELKKRLPPGRGVLGQLGAAPRIGRRDLAAPTLLGPARCPTTLIHVAGLNDPQKLGHAIEVPGVKDKRPSVGAYGSP